MVEAAAEASEELMNKYLDEGDLSEEEIKAALRKRTLALEIFPMLCGSAFKNKGVQAMLDAVVDYLPAPTDVAAIEAHDVEDYDAIVERHADDAEPFRSEEHTSELQSLMRTSYDVFCMTTKRTYACGPHQVT